MLISDLNAGMSITSIGGFRQINEHLEKSIQSEREIVNIGKEYENAIKKGQSAERRKKSLNKKQ